MDSSWECDADQNEEPIQEVKLVKAICPECGNVNRKARRACRNCDRSGFVDKYVPVEVSDVQT